MPVYAAIFVVLMTSCLLEVGQGAALPRLDDDDALNYLEKYGHIKSKQKIGIVKNSYSSSRRQEEYADGLKEFQSSVGLPQTGILDNNTIELMGKARCGVVESIFTSRRKRQTEYRWPMTSLKYRFISYTLKLPTQVTRDIFDKAFKQWTAVVPLTIVEAKPNELEHIAIQFASYDHGDGFPFDGPSNGRTGNTLGHTFYPTDGRSHYDESESWTDQSYYGFNLMSVATHELGHALGLVHSTDSKDIMYPLYRMYSPSFSISPNDVSAIQRLYGPINVDGLPPTPDPDATTTTTTTTTTTSTTTTTTKTPSTKSVVSSSILPRIGTPNPNYNGNNYLTQYPPLLTTPTWSYLGTRTPFRQVNKGTPANLVQPTGYQTSMVQHRGTPSVSVYRRSTPSRLSSFFQTFSRASVLT